MICEKCGQEIPDNAAFCEHCGENFSQAVPAGELQKPENVLTGTVGALLGAAIGGAVIILLSRLGVVAALSGIILAVCTMKGYELLGGRMSKKGIVICAVMMLVMPYLADRLDWAIVIYQQAESEGLNWSYGMCFQLIPELIEEEIIAMEDYVLSLGQIYLFTGLGVVGTLIDRKKKTKKN